VKTKTILSALVILAGVFVTLSTAQAQQEFSYKLGQRITFSLSLSVPRGEQVQNVQLSAWTGNVSPTQQGLNNGFDIACELKTEDTYECSVPIPNVADGEYIISGVSMRLLPFGVNTRIPSDKFPSRKFKIENPLVIPQPTVKDLRETPPR
jgi:hypothetical protein